jgi:hypothetical protein
MIFRENSKVGFGAAYQFLLTVPPIRINIACAESSCSNTISIPFEEISRETSRYVRGIPIIARVYNQAAKAANVSDVYVATDDKRIGEAVTNHGGKVIYTRGDYVCGSDRVAAAMTGISADYVVNLQGDEPLIGRKQSMRW